ITALDLGEERAPRSLLVDTLEALLELGNAGGPLAEEAVDLFGSGHAGNALQPHDDVIGIVPECPEERARVARSIQDPEPEHAARIGGGGPAPNSPVGQATMHVTPSRAPCAWGGPARTVQVRLVRKVRRGHARFGP